MHTALVIDDHESLLHITDLTLKRAGFQTFTSRNGREGLDLLYSQLPHLVIVEHELPGFSGLDICKAVKNSAETRHIKIVLYTTNLTGTYRQAYLDAGVDAIVFKPRTPRELLTTVECCLGAQV